MTESQKQNFVGGLVGSILAKKGVDLVVEKALERVARSPDTTMSPADVPEAAEAVTKAVQQEVEARVEHATNAEPAYQSRVAQGSSAAVLMAIAILWGYWTDGVPQGPEEWTPPLVIVAGAAWALYGRFIASKPFWR